MKKEYICEVISKKMLTADTALISLSCPDIARNAIPGQFVNVSCSRFLKRPFGIASVDKEEGSFKIGIRSVGKGTEELISLDKGDKVNVLGPLGNGFELLTSCGPDEKFILVAGGTGVFPVNFVHEYLRSHDICHKVIEGFRSKDLMLFKDEIMNDNEDYLITTDAGDYGIKGTSVDGLCSLSKEEYENATVLCVGPIPMMKTVGNWASGKGLKCYVSMEQRMACGIGICLVCICKVRAEKEGQEFDHKRCCKDGPVFPYEEVIW